MTAPVMRPRIFWPAVGVGWAIIAFGVFGVLTQANQTHPRSMGIWLVGGLVAHDLIVAPVVFIVGRGLRRVVPEKVRAAVTAGLVLTAMLVVTSIPVLGGFGRRPDNPTILPRDYTVGLLIAIAVVWAVVAGLVAWARWRRTD